MNIYAKPYLLKLRSISIRNKYLDWYCNIIDNAVNRATTRIAAKELLGYTEGHHILPKSFNLGGHTDLHNYAFLTAREHFICHKLLIKFSVNHYRVKMVRAMTAFSIASKKNPRNLTAIQYEDIRKMTVNVSPWNKGLPSSMRGKPSPLKGRTFSLESKIKHQKAMEKRRGVPRSDEVRLAISNGNKGRKLGPQSPELIAKRTAIVKENREKKRLEATRVNSLL
jgi:hypothetical protein